MSENIQSISMGTYTIGQTSATNFVAGNGIKIDQPSAGTVRIGNDETVLWSGASAVNNRGTTLNLSESVYNFERIQVWDDWLNNSPTKITEFSTSGQLGGTTFERFGTWHASVDGYQFESNPSFYIGMNVYSVQNNGNQIRTERNFIAQIKNATTISITERNSSVVYKIVGINRISGNA